MEAVLEWFRTNQPELMQKRMYEVLQMSVLDDSHFGNAAEWFLAFVRYHFEDFTTDTDNSLLGTLQLISRSRSSPSWIS